MARGLFARRLRSVLALVLVGTGGVGGAPARVVRQDATSTARRESPEAAGDLDPTFGNGGIETTDFFGNYDAATSLALQADGKIVLAGVAHHGSALSSSDFALARYNADGSLDPGFGTGGKQTTDFLGDYDQANGVAIQPDSRIVVAGNTERGLTAVADFAVARYSAATVPDFTISFSPTSVSAQAGSKLGVTVLINRTAGFTGNVTVTPPPASMGIKPKPPDPIMTTGISAVFKMKVGAGVGPGSYSRTFTATDDSGRTRTATLAIVVQ